MKRTWRFLFVVLAAGLILSSWLLVISPSHASGTVRYVSTDGSCNGQNPCYATIQAAVDAASTGDELRVAAGTYSGVSTRNEKTQHVYLDKPLTIQGGYHPATWLLDPELNPTILDAQDQGRVFYITGDISPLIDGFHITNGLGDFGGGVYVLNSSPTLSHNQIFGNHAVGWGGGILLDGSSATIQSNHIYNNTTGESGRGGGLRLTNSPATIQDNVIEGNISHVGGGIDLENYLDNTGAVVIGNSILDNQALDWVEDSTTYAGAGGGINTRSYALDTIQSNTINRNTAKWGGGVHAFGASIAILDNLIQENNAPTHGGGLYVQGGAQVTIQGNEIKFNQAGSWGGGLTLLVIEGLIEKNIFQGNNSSWRGGGLYASSGARFDGNLFMDNTAVEEGGGAFLLEDANALYQNSVFIRNQAKEGGGIYIWGATASLLHTTIADNTSDDGRAVVIDKYPGLELPEDPTIKTSTVSFTNTIVANQSIGFFVTSENTVTLDGILWFQTVTHTQADGAFLTVMNEHTGDPAFQADGYHLHMSSAARDVASSTLDHDIDGHLREAGDHKDLGADEYVPVVMIEPETGGELTYIDQQQGVTITVDIPPNAVMDPWSLMFSPFPPLPPDVMNTPLGQFVAVGPPFRLDVFETDSTVPDPDPADPPLGDPSEPLIFDDPANIAVNYDLEKLKILRDAMASLELQLLSILDNEVKLNEPILPACGPVNHDLEGQTMEVPICDTGIIPETSGTTAGLPVRLLAVDAGTQNGYFMFVVELPVTNVYLPVIVR